MSTKKRVLMVRIGNTCRSLIAEAVFRKYITENNIQDNCEVDSAALFGYHEEKCINPKSAEILERNRITDYSHVARIVGSTIKDKKEDFVTFDWIFGMDYYNIEYLNRIQQGTGAKIELLGQYDPNRKIIIENPYFAKNV